VFTGLPLNLAIKLRAQVQCNALGWASLGLDQIRVKIGNTHVFSVEDQVQVPDRACENNCSRYFDLFAPDFDVGAHVSAFGELYVSVEGNAEVDLCGKGYFLMALLGLEWTPALDAVHTAVVAATWKGAAGQLDVSIPEGMYALGDVVLSFVLRNPLGEHPGSYGWIQVVTPQGAVYGPGQAKGLVLLASRQASISLASMTESTHIQGTLNMLELELGFNGQIGAREGVWITISGLYHSSTPSTNQLKLGACTHCAPAPITYSSSFSRPEAIDLLSFVVLPDRASASWDQENGVLIFYLRAPGPSYVIEQTKLRAVAPLRNSMVQQLGSLPRVSVGGSLVSGTPSAPSTSFGSTRIFGAQDAAHVVLGHLEYAQSIAYGRPRILIKFTTTYDVMHGDLVRLVVPSLTTCNVFCYQGHCEKDGCETGGETRAFYVQLHNSTMSASGEGTDFMTAVWREAESELVLSLSGGRGFCQGLEQAILISPDECSNRNVPSNVEVCKFQVLPDDFVDDERKSLETRIAGCVNTSACDDLKPSLLTNTPVDTHAGFYWAKTSEGFDEAACARGAGRAWFTAQVHQDSVFVLGGLTPCGFGSTTRVSADGDTWTSVPQIPVTNASNNTDHIRMDTPPNPWPRALFSTASFRGDLWVFGGNRLDLQSVQNDVWRSSDGAHWELVTSAAAWQPRMQHASFVFQDKIWLIAGRNQSSGQGALCDVWSSRDGRSCTLATSCAPFASRVGHGAIEFASRMWVYGGGETSSDVWSSANGVDWVQPLFRAVVESQSSCRSSL